MEAIIAHEKKWCENVCTALPKCMLSLDNEHHMQPLPSERTSPNVFTETEKTTKIGNKCSQDYEMTTQEASRTIISMNVEK